MSNAKQIADARAALRALLDSWPLALAKQVIGLEIHRFGCGVAHYDWDSQPLGQISDEEIASILGCSRLAVFAARKKRGIPCYKKPVAERRAKVAEMRAQGLRHRDIATRLGVSEETISADVAVLKKAASR